VTPPGTSNKDTAPPGPPPCKPITPAPTADQTKARFNQFADAFLNKKDLNAAFRFVSANYVVSCHASKRGVSFFFFFFPSLTKALRTITLVLAMDLQQR